MFPIVLQARTCVSEAVELMPSKSRSLSAFCSPLMWWPLDREPLRTVPFSVGPGPHRGCHIAVPEERKIVHISLCRVVYVTRSYVNFIKLQNKSQYNIQLCAIILRSGVYIVSSTCKLPFCLLEKFYNTWVPYLVNTSLRHRQRGHHIWYTGHRWDGSGGCLQPGVPYHWWSGCSMHTSPQTGPGSPSHSKVAHPWCPRRQQDISQYWVCLIKYL